MWLNMRLTALNLSCPAHADVCPHLAARQTDDRCLGVGPQRARGRANPPANPRKASGKAVKAKKQWKANETPPKSQ